MSDVTATLARFITREASKQSYLIARLLADRDLVDDCLRAYAYFRWADDVVDAQGRPAAERIAFIERQTALVDALYRNERPEDLTPEEAILADLIEHDRGENSGLQEYIRSFIEVLSFDARRKGKTISQAELTCYSNRLGKAVTDAIQYFIGNEHTYPDTDNRYLAATAAHITHMLRDMVDDLEQGFVNIPQEWLAAQQTGLDPEAIGPEFVTSRPFRAWVQRQVEQARAYFRDGKRYLNELDVLRCKIAGYWYCARFECVLDVIERDDYLLRPHYESRRNYLTWLKMGWLTVSLTLGHLTRRRRRASREAAGGPGYQGPAVEHLRGGKL